jgi:hypothetical protein
MMTLSQHKRGRKKKKNKKLKQDPMLVARGDAVVAE